MTGSTVIDRPEGPVEDLLLGSPADLPKLGDTAAGIRTQTALHLGLTRQIDPATIPKTAERAAQHYSEWRGIRLEVWSEFMPTHYPQSAWPDYSFDVIPVRALKAIEAAVSADLFDRLEIWTPEPVKVTTFREAFSLSKNQLRAQMKREIQAFIDDPVAVGVVEDRFFPIVRWGREEIIPEHRVAVVGGFRAIRRRILDRR